MPTRQTYPGVHVQENSFPPSVVGVHTATAAFLGYSEKAEDSKSGAALTGIPRSVASLAEFEQAFGGPFQGILPGGAAGPWLHDAVSLFYANGGGTAWIVSAGDYAALEGDMGKSALDPARLRSALEAIGGQAGLALLAAPDALLMSAEDYYAFAAAMLAQAETLGDRFVLIDVPGDPEAGVGHFQATMEPLPGRTWGAAYFPPVLAADGTSRPIPCSGAILGAIATNDRSRGVWEAPANIPILGTGGPAVFVPEFEQAAISAPRNGVSVNLLREIPGRGFLIWGARTLDCLDSDFLYVPVRRTIIYVTQSVNAALARFAFAPNDSAAWTAAATIVENFLADLWRQGGLVGSTPQEAFSVSCGLGSTMTAQDILDGRMTVTILAALLHPAEFMRLDFVQAMQPPG